MRLSVKVLLLIIWHATLYQHLIRLALSVCQLFQVLAMLGSFFKKLLVKLLHFLPQYYDRIQQAANASRVEASLQDRRDIGWHGLGNPQQYSACGKEENGLAHALISFL